MLGGSALVIGALLALPVMYVVASFFAGTGDAWAHLAATALPRYVWNRSCCCWQSHGA